MNRATNDTQAEFHWLNW